jgi:riboflavin kinase/FMN adenylyltransferase
MFSYNKNDFSLNAPTAVALGCFDGVHIGHRAVISEAVTIAKQRGIQSAVWCFESPPKNYFLKDSAPLITPPDEKISLISDLGVDVVVCVPFDMDIGGLTPEEFFYEILINKMKAAHIVCGSNYTFGKNGSGNAEYLSELCQKNGIGFTSLGHICADGISVSASAIREMIKKGDLSEVELLLGRNYSISGTVINGNHLGRTLGFPTANIEIKRGCVVPKNGVYLTKVYVDGVERFGITNVGRHPTVLAENLLAETFLFDFDSDIYGKELKLEFIEFMRKEKTFDSLDSLTLQVSSDIEKAKLLIEKKYS